MSRKVTQLLGSMRDSVSLSPTTVAQSPAEPVVDPLAGARRITQAYQLELNRIVADPDQPRTEFPAEELEAMRATLEVHGVLQPIRVRYIKPQDVYMIIAGERRWRAARLLGLTSIPAIVVTADDRADILEQQLIENASRADLKPMEQARAYARLLELRGWSHGELARRLGIHKSAVTRAVSLLGLPDQVQTEVDTGSLTPSAAYEISKVEDPDTQVTLAVAATQQRLTRTEVTEAVRATRERKTATRMPRQSMSLDLGDLGQLTIRYDDPTGIGLRKLLQQAIRRLPDQKAS